MSARKIAILNPTKIAPRTLLAQIAEHDDLDAVVAVAKIGGRWQCCWSSGVDLGGLSMAAMKLSADIMYEIHREDRDPRPGVTPPENQPA